MFSSEKNIAWPIFRFVLLYVRAIVPPRPLHLTHTYQSIYKEHTHSGGEHGGNGGMPCACLRTPSKQMSQVPCSTFGCYMYVRSCHPALIPATPASPYTKNTLCLALALLDFPGKGIKFQRTSSGYLCRNHVVPGSCFQMCIPLCFCLFGIHVGFIFCVVCITFSSIVLG